MRKNNPALDALRRHVTGAIEAGRAEPIVERLPSQFLTDEQRTAYVLVPGSTVTWLVMRGQARYAHARLSGHDVFEVVGMTVDAAVREYAAHNPVPSEAGRAEPIVERPTLSLQDSLRAIAERLERDGHPATALAVRRRLERLEDADIVDAPSVPSGYNVTG